MSRRRLRPLLRRGGRVLCIVALLLSVRSLAAELPPALHELAQRLHGERMQCVPFEQRKHLHALQRELKFTGTLSVTADQRVLWQLLTPVQAEYQFLATGAWRRSAGQPWVRMAVPDAATRALHSMLSALLRMDAAALSSQFDLQVVSTQPLEFTAIPRDRRLRAAVPKLRLQASTRIDLLRIDEVSGNWSEYRFLPAVQTEACQLPAPPR